MSLYQFDIVDIYKYDIDLTVFVDVVDVDMTFSLHGIQCHYFLYVNITMLTQYQVYIVYFVAQC
jgi:hypothetical protein